MEGMDVRLLGPFEAYADGRPLPLGGRKQRALLALLALHGGRTLSTAWLVEELWGEDAPETAAKMVQIYVSQLRKALPPACPAGGLSAQMRPPCACTSWRAIASPNPDPPLRRLREGSAR